MKTLLLLTLLLPPVQPAQPQQPAAAGVADEAPVSVVGAKWERSRQAAAKQEAAGTGPAAAMIPANRNFERNRRINDPPAARDPNADTIDGRSAAIEKNVQQARAAKPKVVDGFAYRVKVRNTAAKPVAVLFIEYEFTETANPANVARRQFLCGVQLKPNKEKELQAFSLNGPSDTISAAGLSGEKAVGLYRERALVNRIEYEDGTIWQRKGWSYADVRAGVARAVSTPWGAETCRGL